MTTAFRIKAWAAEQLRSLDRLPMEAGAKRIDCDGNLMIVTEYDVAWWTLARKQVCAILGIEP